MKEKNTKPFSLLEKYWDKHGSNAYKFDDNVLLCTHQFESGNTDHLKDENEWGAVDICAFDSEEQFDELYDLAKNSKNRIYLKL